MKKLISIVIVLAFFLVFTNFVSAETFCKDSDGGDDFKIKGVVTYDSGDGSQNNQEDYCVTDKELREYYCDVNLEKPVQLLVTQCEEACACGRCFDKEEEVNCEKNYEEYCKYFLQSLKQNPPFVRFCIYLQYSGPIQQLQYY